MATDPESALEQTERLFMQALMNREDSAGEYLAIRYRTAAEYLEPLFLQAYDELQRLQRMGVPLADLSGYLWKEQRLAQLLSEASAITQRLADDYAIQLAASTQDASRLATQSFRAQMLGAPDGPAVGFGAFPEESFTSMVARLDAGSPILQSVRQYGEQAPSVVTNELLAGIANGESPLLVAARISNALGSNYGKMAILTHTHMLNTYRDTTQRVYQANARYLEGWRWSSALDLRTCPICWALHGQVFPVTERMATHPACRCSMRPVVRNWKDINPLYPDTHAMKPAEVMGPDKFAKLSRADQARILGPVGAEAYRRKLFTLPQLVQDTYSPVWGAGRRQRSIRSVIGLDRYRDVSRAIFSKPKRITQLPLPPARPAKRPITPARKPKPRAQPPAAMATPKIAPQAPASWRPNMPAAEANAWAMQGDLTRPLYHVTSKEGAQGITLEGFDLKRTKWGRVWGNGAYMSDTAASEAMYSSAFAEPTKLQLRVFSRKTLRVDISGTPDGEWGPETVLRAIPGDMPSAVDRYLDRVATLEAQNRIFLDSLPRNRFAWPNQPVTEADREESRRWRMNRQMETERAEREGRYVSDVRAEAFTATLRDDYGYDALDLVDEPHRASVGGSQVVVFDPQRVVVVKD